MRRIKFYRVSMKFHTMHSSKILTASCVENFVNKIKKKRKRTVQLLNLKKSKYKTPAELLVTTGTHAPPGYTQDNFVPDLIKVVHFLLMKKLCQKKVLL